MSPEEITKKAGGRKYTLSLLVFISTILLLLAEKITKQDYSTLLFLVLTTYVAGNLLQNLLLPKDQPVPNVNDDTLGLLPDRMFRLVILMFVTTVILLWLDYLDSSVFLEIVRWQAVFYTGGNVVSKLTENGLKLEFSKKE